MNVLPALVLGATLLLGACGASERDLSPLRGTMQSLEEAQPANPRPAYERNNAGRFPPHRAFQ